ncbi:MAG: hypothetical protein ACXV5T_05240 [Halobacteriota archaeon]
MGLGTGTTEPDVACMAFMGYEQYGTSRYVRCGAFGLMPADACKKCTEFRAIAVPDYYR